MTDSQQGYSCLTAYFVYKDEVNGAGTHDIVKVGKTYIDAGLTSFADEGQTFVALNDGDYRPVPGVDTYDTSNGTVIQGTPQTLTPPALFVQPATPTMPNVIGCNALGDLYFYPTSPEAVLDMIRVSLTGGKLWCTKNGTSAYVTHTTAQALEVYTKYSQKLDDVRSAT